MKKYFFSVLILCLHTVFLYADEAVNNAGSDNILPENSGSSILKVVTEDSTSPMLFPFMLKLNFQITSGTTDVNIYSDENKIIADGSAAFTQYRGSVSYEPVSTEYFFITPEFGYFYRNVSVKDYSFNTAQSNQYNQGFIPGIISDPLTGEAYPKDAVYSLAYKARFSSLFADLRCGSRLVIGTDIAQLILNPSLSVNVAERRRAVFSFEIGGKSENYTEGYKYSYFSSWGFGFESGMYFPLQRTGFIFGYERRYFRKIQIPETIQFNEIYYDSSLNLLRTREISAKYTDLKADLFTFSVFTFL